MHLLWRATAMPVLHGSGWLGISPSANTKPFLHPSQAEISRQKIKLGDLPHWVRSRLSHSRWHFSRPQHATTWSQKWRKDVTPCHQSSSKIKKLWETCIALDWMACYKGTAGVWNISKTGHLHLCMGSNTNWPRVSGWSCTLLCFTWPVQEVNDNVNNMRRSTSYRSYGSWLWKYLASKPRLRGDPLFESWLDP